MLVRDLQEDRTEPAEYIEKYMRRDLLEELIHMITEAERSFERVSTSCRTMEIHTVAQTRSKGLRTNESVGVIHSRPKT